MRVSVKAICNQPTANTNVCYHGYLAGIGILRCKRLWDLLFYIYRVFHSTVIREISECDMREVKKMYIIHICKLSLQPTALRLVNIDVQDV
jgi:hypothetical protein